MTQVIRRFVVTGKVQGVFFRQGTQREAERLGLRGVARNLPDGTVEVIAVGEGTAVDGLRLWLETGPPHARVSAVHEVAASSDGHGFPATFITE